MFKALFLATIISLALFTPKVSAAFDCLKVNVQDEALYMLCPFERHGAYSVATALDIKNEDESITKSQLNVNFTFPLGKLKNCEGKEMIWATYNTSTQNVCHNMVTAKPKYKLIDETNATAGVAIVFPKNEDAKKQLTIYLQCDRSVSMEAETVFKITNVVDGGIDIVGNSPYGCPIVSTTELENLVHTNRWIFATVLFVMGVFLLFLGLAMFKYAVFLIVFLLVTVGLGFTLFSFITYTTPRYVLYIVFGFCVIVGLGAGYLSLRYKKFGFLAVGIALGIIGGLFLCSALLKSLIQERLWLFILIVGVCGLIGGILIFVLRKNITIIATACIGSYTTVRAISLFIKHFPSEIGMARGTAQFTAWGYFYLALMVVFAVGGIFVQHIFKRRREAEEKKILDQGYAVAPEMAKV